MNIETCEQKCIHFPWECALFLQNNKELATPLLEVAEYGKLNLLVSVCGYLSAFCSLAVIYFHLFCQGNWDSYVLHVIFSLSVLVCHLHTLEVLKLKKNKKTRLQRKSFGGVGERRREGRVQKIVTESIVCTIFNIMSGWKNDTI